MVSTAVIFTGSLYLPRHSNCQQDFVGTGFLLVIVWSSVLGNDSTFHVL